ncbi:EAL domain-containing protein [Hydrogenovibrio sp. 3SP14C1]|uniref:sensor domain-containing phosphodiesterase n=1 Tax=Hydrogenovibrio sp. 3SP14C1 TaxID=3038774 RepID=UPI002415D421|nr:EAL domain-containing protein [Hydrogenovibrio sp. 3SP14C1]MDG4813124.1 EAL domain-containing protein [Hydrogenovibrio sp. 3SP14C1]
MQSPQKADTQTLNIESKKLYSVFQPIYSFSNQACVGVEALVRGTSLETGFQVTVDECLTVPNSMKQANFSQALNQLHVTNWQQSKLPDNWLFLNLDFENVTNLDDICIEQVLKDLNIKGHEIVIEVVESEITDETLFEQVIETLRGLGCLIALDDFGAGHSNVDRIWKAQPDIVKLDRGVLLEASKSLRSQSILKNLTRLIKEAGSVCLLEGVETKEQALLAMDAGVDLVQGFYFARPHQLLDQVEKGQRCVKEVIDEYPLYIKERTFITSIQRKGYEALFESMEELDQFDFLEERMADHVSNLSFVKRFFILDQEGFQVSNEYDPPSVEDRVEVLKKGKGLCWKNRRYFTKALQKSGNIHVSEPYRSLIDMQLCFTISKQVFLEEGNFVACFDVVYHDKSMESVQISI